MSFAVDLDESDPDFVPKLSIRIQELMTPVFVLCHAAIAFVHSTFEAILTSGIFTIFSPSLIREKAFTRFWDEYGAQASLALHPSACQLLYRVDGNLVLEIGPGSGHLIPFYARADRIGTMYAVEPAKGLHQGLRSAVSKSPLKGKYHVLGVRASPDELFPALYRRGVVANTSNEVAVFDTIVCFRVLCSVEDVQATCELLYALLRPGGSLIFYEHVRARPDYDGTWLARAAQMAVHALGWPFLTGNCHLDRDTVQVLKRVADPDGGWKTVRIETADNWSTMPYAFGRLIKRDPNVRRGMAARA